MQGYKILKFSFSLPLDSFQPLLFYLAKGMILFCQGYNSMLNAYSCVSICPKIHLIQCFHSILVKCYATTNFINALKNAII